MDSGEGGQYGSTGQTNNVSSKKLQQTHAQVNEVVDIMRDNVEKVIDRDVKLSELDDRADALQQGASQFETQAAALKRKYWWKNMKMWILLGVVGLLVIGVFFLNSKEKEGGNQGWNEEYMRGPPAAGLGGQGVGPETGLEGAGALGENGNAQVGQGLNGINGLQQNPGMLNTQTGLSNQNQMNLPEGQGETMISNEDESNGLGLTSNESTGNGNQQQRSASNLANTGLQDQLDNNSISNERKRRMINTVNMIKNMQMMREMERMQARRNFMNFRNNLNLNI